MKTLPVMGKTWWRKPPDSMIEEIERLALARVYERVLCPQRDKGNLLPKKLQDTSMWD